jgi:hypothetical protein
MSQFIPITRDTERSSLSCFSEVLQGCLPRHPGIGRAFLIQEYTVSQAENDRLISDGLRALAPFAPFADTDYVFIDRSTEAGGLVRRLPMVRALCAAIGFPLRNVLYVSQNSGRVLAPDQCPEAYAPRWIFFHSYGIRFARTHRNREFDGSLARCTGKVLCMNNKLRPHRIAVAVAARRLCQERLILSWGGNTSLYTRDRALAEFRAKFPSLSGEPVDFEESALEVDPSLGNIHGVPEGPASASFLHLVTESDYLPWSDRFTEKLLKPVVAGRPFLAFGPPGVLRTFRSVGFRTFAGIFDESYDEVADPDERLARMMQTLRDLLQRPYLDILRECTEICTYNKEFLRFGLEDTLVGMFHRRLAEIAGPGG